MSVRIIDGRQDGTIPVRELRDGQLGEIVEWGAPKYHGDIVQPRGKELVAVGKPNGESWAHIPQEDNRRVRVLPNGTWLEVTDNE